MNELITKIKQHFCKHEFAIEDLLLTGEFDTKKRVLWYCSKCSKKFHAHCGLDISPKHGPMYRRNPFSSEADDD